MWRLDTLQRDMVIEGLDDYVGLWESVNWVARVDGPLDGDGMRANVMRRLRPLLLDGLVEPGFPSADGGFDSWSLNAEEAMERIETEWRALGRDPNIWDVCWFRNTPKGNALARTTG